MLTDASQEIPIVLWLGKFHYGAHKSLPLIPVLDKMNQVYILPSCFSVSTKYFKYDQIVKDEMGGTGGCMGVRTHAEF
jgi:hypothetical protein